MNTSAVLQPGSKYVEKKHIKENRDNTMFLHQTWRLMCLLMCSLLIPNFRQSHGVGKRENKEQNSSLFIKKVNNVPTPQFSVYCLCSLKTILLKHWVAFLFEFKKCTF